MPPQKQRWPDDRAVLFVHGVGNAKPGSYDALLDQVKKLLGADAESFAFYFLYYDQLNAWAAAKLAAADRITDLCRVIRGELTQSAETAEVIAGFAGDVIWPVLLADARNAVRAAYVAQLQQMVLDGKNNGRRRARDLHMTIIAHSLGCFHTYETLQAITADAGLGLAPATWNTQFDNVIYMASPVQLIRSVTQKLTFAIPLRDKLYSLAGGGLSAPGERDAAGELVPTVRERIVSITGNLDPVGGYFFRSRGDWAYMNLPGQLSIIDKQTPAAVPGLNDEQSLAAVLRSALVSGAPPTISPENPHDWSAYVDRHASELKEWMTA